MKPREWLFLIHRIPAKPLYLRAKIRSRLARAGAAPLKKAVYALPRREGALAQLQEVADEIRQAGGEAFVCEARFTASEDEAALLSAFRDQSRLEYRRVLAAASALLHRFERRAIGEPALRTGHSKLARRLEQARSADFFDAGGHAEAEAQLVDMARRPKRDSRAAARPASRWTGRMWVTRAGILVDRIACAWFIRRFLDPTARIRFASAPYTLRAGELGFDMPGGEFSHEDGGCSLETLIAKTGVDDPALARIARLVHALDLKDERFDVPEAPGVEQLLLGMAVAHPDDESRLERGMTFFDDLYRSWAAVSVPKSPLSRSRKALGSREGRS